MTHEEAEERLRSGWHVEPPLLELIEGDYDSAQRKRFLRAAQNDCLHPLMAAHAEDHCNGSQKKATRKGGSIWCEGG